MHYYEEVSFKILAEIQLIVKSFYFVFLSSLYCCSWISFEWDNIELQIQRVFWCNRNILQNSLHEGNPLNLASQQTATLPNELSMIRWKESSETFKSVESIVTISLPRCIQLHIFKSETPKISHDALAQQWRGVRKRSRQQSSNCWGWSRSFYYWWGADLFEMFSFMFNDSLV